MYFPGLHLEASGFFYILDDDINTEQASGICCHTISYQASVRTLPTGLWNIYKHYILCNDAVALLIRAIRSY